MPTCRDEILAGLPRVTAPDGTFALAAVVAALRSAGSTYTEATIRTHITSRMCVNAPAHHGSRSGDLERVGRGVYPRRAG